MDQESEESRPVPFESSLLKERDEEPQSRVLDTSSYSNGSERVVPDYGEAVYESKCCCKGSSSLV